MTQISNPKTAIVYASVFAAFAPDAADAGFAATVVALVFMVETGWYTLVALTLSAPWPRAVYLRGKTWVDRVAGTVLAGLGLKLVATAHRG